MNGTDEVMKLTLNLPMLAGKTVTYYYETASKDKKALWPVSQMKTVKVDKKGNLKVEMQPKGGLIVKKPFYRNVPKQQLCHLLHWKA